MPSRERDEERGQATVLIIGFAVVLAMAVAMVVDASAAYLQRQGLDTLADGAALRGADLGATGEEVYTGGVPERGSSSPPTPVRAGGARLPAPSGAYARYPGLTFTVDVDQATST